MKIKMEYEETACDYCKLPEDLSQRRHVLVCPICGADVCEDCLVNIRYRSINGNLIKAWDKSICKKHLLSELYKEIEKK